MIHEVNMMLYSVNVMGIIYNNKILRMKPRLKNFRMPDKDEFMNI